MCLCVRPRMFVEPAALSGSCPIVPTSNYGARFSAVCRRGRASMLDVFITPTSSCLMFLTSVVKQTIFLVRRCCNSISIFNVFYIDSRANDIFCTWLLICRRFMFSISIVRERYFLTLLLCRCSMFLTLIVKQTSFFVNRCF